MTAQASPHPVPGPGQPSPGRSPAPSGAAVTSGPTAREHHPALTTPALLRLLVAACTLACLLFGIGTAATLVGGSSAMDRATRNAAQLARVQAIQASLLHADAIATNAYLGGGLESPAQRAEYARAMDDVARLIPEAGEAQPADRDALRALNAEVVAYATTMEQARANNRQGFPLGGAYLADAGSHLRRGAMPLLDSLVAANDQRVLTELAWVDRTWVVPLGLLATLVLVVALVLVARRFRRIVNIGLAVALALVVAALLTLGLLVSTVRDGVHGVRDGSLQTARSIGVARGHADEAKAYEALTLIARDGGGSNDAAWAMASLRTRRALRAIPDGAVRSAMSADFAAHTVSHRRIREFDRDGNWDQARVEAAGTGPTSSNATFARFDERASAAAQAAGEQTTTRLRAQRPLLVTGAIVALLASLGAVAAAWRGVSTRLKEFA